MLSPASKGKAASIWSFDSGYGSSTLEDDEVFQIDQPGSSSVYAKLSSSLQQHDDSNLGDSLNLDIGDETHSRDFTSSTKPQAMQVDVFTAKVRCSNESLAPTQNNDLDCLRCQLWNIIHPEENSRCDDCTSKGFGALEAVRGAVEQPVTSTVTFHLDLLSAPPSKRGSQFEGTGRCSACEISALIDPGKTVSCASCAPKTALPSPFPAHQPSKVRRSCARRPPTKLESHATRCLQAWLREHRNNPYPDAETKQSLAEKCGITEKQVNTWFTNARARRKIGDANSSNPGSEDEGSRKTRLSSVASTAMSNPDISSGYEAPCQRRCPGVSCHTGNCQSHNHTNTNNSRRGKKKDYGQSNMVPSVAHRALSIPSTLTFGSANDVESESQTWQCTFCYQHIARKSWRRHEETQHRPKRKWTCLLTGPRLKIPSRSDASTFCVFCMIPDPSDKHFAECHRITECMFKDKHERTFLRPDHLRQHVKNFHKSKLNETVRDLWRQEGSGNDVAENWVCGFCTQVLKTWDDRETHISGHFKDGLTMMDWKGYTRQDAEVKASKKRPTSSEGRPNVLAKLARTLTGRSMREQHRDDSQSLVVDTFSAAPISTHAPELNQPLLPELVFDDFMPGIDDGYFDYNGTTVADAYEQGLASDERHDSVFPDGNTTEFDFSNVAEDFIDGDLLNANMLGLWYQ